MGVEGVEIVISVPYLLSMRSLWGLPRSCLGQITARVTYVGVVAIWLTAEVMGMAEIPLGECAG